MNTSKATGSGWLIGGGEMGKLVRSMDWSKTPLGPITSWPSSLRTTVNLALASNFPISIAWGAARTQIYNDGYWPICGGKHPDSMGQDFKECWFSAWDAVSEPFERALAGETTFLEDQRMFLDRNGYLEETFFTFSFSPIRDETGRVGGLFHPVNEVTARLLAERRLGVVRELSECVLDARSVADASALIIRALARHRLDLPFVLLYLFTDDDKVARLAGAAHIPPGSAAAPNEISLTADGSLAWPLFHTARAPTVVEVVELQRCAGLSDCGPYPEAASAAMMLPLVVAGRAKPLGVLIAGVSPRRAVDDSYRTFFSMLQEAAATAFTNARSYEHERKRAEALAELDRAKTVFFSNVSHEFRTPLTLILGPLKQAMASGRLAASDHGQLEIAHRNSLRLLKLVNSLLEFSRIEAGRPQATYEPTDLAALTAELASNFRSACEAASLALSVDCPALPELVYVDRDMWEKVVLNLVSNAFKFTLEGTIEVSLRAVPRGAELRVRDTGAGIPSQELPRLFERFHRVDGMRGRTLEGTGIGLALVHELVRLHGGSIAVESETGRGSTFTVTIPGGSAHLPPDCIGAERKLPSTSPGADAYVQEALRWLPDVDVREQPESPPREAIPSAAELALEGEPRSRILIADDNADMRQYLRSLLGGSSTVSAYGDGKSALEASLRDPPDLVLADVMMPGIDGFSLLRALREDFRTRKIPVVLLSARAGEEARLEGIRAGADDYLVKPFSASELVARIGTHLRLSRMREEMNTALRRSEERFRAFVTASSDIIYQMSPDWSVMRALDGRGLIDDTKEPSKSWLDQYIHPEDQARVLATIRESVLTKSKFELEHRVRRIDGTLGWALSRAVPLLDEAGEIVEWFGAASDVTARRQAEEALRRDGRAKDEFLAILGHELRNPLAPMVTGLALLERESSDRELVGKITTMMGRQLTHMRRLVDDLLDVSRITRNKVDLKRAPLRLRTPLEAAIEQVRGVLQERHHELQLQFSHLDPIVSGDLERLTQVFANLLHNAAKYMDPGGTVWVRSTIENGAAVVRVRDTGYGIPADGLEDLFELFTQIPQHRELTGGGGLGIGLALSQRLIQMHGGVVEAYSAGLGSGSEFVVRLPVCTGEAPAAVSGTRARPAGPARRILVVDDNLDAAETLQLLLSLNGHNVETSHDGPTALERVASFAPELVLLDLGLPGMDGVEVGRRIRAMDGGARIRLIAVTGWGQADARRRTREAGFDDHLAKPLDAAQLSSLIDGRAGSDRAS